MILGKGLRVITNDPQGGAGILTGILFSSRRDQAVRLSCCVDVLTFQGHSINMASLPQTEGGSGWQESLEMAGPFPSRGKEGFVSSASLPLGVPLAGRIPLCSSLSLPALMKRPGPEVAGRLKGKSSRYRWAALQFLVTLVFQSTDAETPASLLCLALLLGPRGLSSSRGLRSLSILQ